MVVLVQLLFGTSLTAAATSALRHGAIGWALVAGVLATLVMTPLALACLQLWRENVLRVPTDLVPGLAVTLSGWEAERDRLQGELKRLVTGKHHAERKEVLRVAEVQLWKWRERISSSDPETVRALLLELVDRVEVFFVEKARGKRRYMAFELGVIYPKADPSYGTSRS